MNGLKKIGFAGVILAYAKEVVVHNGNDMSRWKRLDDAVVEADVASWKNGNLKTIDLTGSGEFVGLKYEVLPIYSSASSDAFPGSRVLVGMLYNYLPNSSLLVRFSIGQRPMFVSLPKPGTFVFCSMPSNRLSSTA